MADHMRYGSRGGATLIPSRAASIPAIVVGLVLSTPFHTAPASGADSCPTEVDAAVRTFLTLADGNQWADLYAHQFSRRLKAQITSEGMAKFLLGTTMFNYGGRVTGRRSVASASVNEIPKSPTTRKEGAGVRFAVGAFLPDFAPAEALKGPFCMLRYRAQYPSGDAEEALLFEKEDDGRFRLVGAEQTRF